MTVIYFVRHGITLANLKYDMMGRTDEPLHELGVQQADCVAIALQEKPFQAIITSPLLRAQQTALCIAKQHNCVPFTVMPELCELDLGIVDGLSSFNAYEQYRDIMDQALDVTRDDFAFPNGESWVKALERFTHAIEQLVQLYPNGCICVVTHGGPLGLWLARQHTLSLGQFRKLQPSHASITKVVHTNGHYLLEQVNQQQHVAHLSAKIEEARNRLP